MTWPAHPAVARAYLEQLERDASLTAALASDIGAALHRVEAVDDDARDARLAAKLDSLAGQLDAAGGRREALAQTLRGLSARLR